jgi:uncharacterized protein (DUF433 family)
MLAAKSSTGASTRAGLSRNAHAAARRASRPWPAALLERAAPCIRGHRIWLSLVLDLLAGGRTVKEILEDYPYLDEADIRACIAYGAEMARERYVDVPLSKTS